MRDPATELPSISVRSKSAIPACELRTLADITKVRVQVLRPRGEQTPAADPERLPHHPNTAIGSDPIALWRAPDDWLVFSASHRASELAGWIESAARAPLVLTDVSGGSTVLQLSGPAAVDVLMRDCTLDLEADLFPVQSCAQTLFAGTSALLFRPVSPDTWLLFVERAVARHVRDWLLASMARGVT